MEKNILIVDDSPTMRASLSFCLTNAGYTVFEAVDGKDGLAKLREVEAQEKLPALIIADINMPKMDGITFITEVKQTDWKFIPILVLTTESQDEQKMRGRSAGAAGWLLKPFRPEELLWVVKKFVR
ncbi:MAG: two-component system response regulator [Desulfuromonadales bacterium C00003093]|nr:MAG: two-component system response regulator [Desulfuromonadales bacterium C00003093]